MNLFHAGTALKDETLTTSRGRMIAVSATVDTLETALKAVFAGILTIHFDKGFIPEGHWS